jgi:hypothetical protein
VDNRLDNVALFFDTLRRSHEALQFSMEHGGDIRSSLWLMAGSCEMIAHEWGAAVGYAAALNDDWWAFGEVAGAGGLSVIPPSAPAYSEEMNQACTLTDVREPADWANGLRTAAKHREAALEELKNEQKKWTRERDDALAKCEASGWKRRHEPGYWQNAKLTAPGADAAP